MLRKNIKSFADWCIEHDKLNYLDLWDYELNDLSPTEVSSRNSTGKYYFKCAAGKHESFLKGINNLENSKDCTCPRCNSIYQWCLDNNREDIIEAWDKNKNDISMDLVSAHSGKKCWFTFKHYSYYYTVSYITADNKNVDPVLKYFNSVGYYLISHYGDDAINMYWSDKNKRSAFEYDRGSGKEVWFKCTEKDYHDDYLSRPYAFVGMGCRCPMCSSKIIHPFDSFAQYNINRYGEKWLEETWCDDNVLDPYKITAKNNEIKVHLRCRKNPEYTFWISPVYYDNDYDMCYYCTKSPQDVETFICNSNKENHRLCCQKISSYEQHFRDYVETLGYTINYEYNCTIIPINPITNYPLPLDNEIEELKLICEVMGSQHYKLSLFHYLAAKQNNTTPEQEFENQKERDKFKKDYIISHGYYYLEVPYTSFNKNNDFIKLVQDKISEILKSKSVTTAGCIQ